MKTSKVQELSENELQIVHQRWQESLIRQKEQLEETQQTEKDYKQLDSKLQELPTKVSHKVMVPLGDLAFMPGEIVHTNEIMVLLGENYFVKRTAEQARGIIKRRLKVVTEKVNAQKQNIQQLYSKMGFTQDFASLAEEYRDVVDIKETLEEEEEAQRRKQEKMNKKGKEPAAQKKEPTFKNILEKQQDESIERLLDELYLQEQEEERLGVTTSTGAEDEEKEAEEPLGSEEPKEIIEYEEVTEAPKAPESSMKNPGDIFKAYLKTSTEEHQKKVEKTRREIQIEDDMEEEFQKYFNENPSAAKDPLLTGSMSLKQPVVAPKPVVEQQPVAKGFQAKVVERAPTTSVPAPQQQSPAPTQEKKKVSLFKQMRMKQ